MNRLSLALVIGLFVAGCMSSRAPDAASTSTVTDVQRTESQRTDAGIEISLADETGQTREARQQLRRLLSSYDLDPWIVTQEVQIETGVDPHSHPVLTLNTNHLRDDETQLSIFLHEQAHWFVGRSVRPFAPEAGEEKQAVIKDLEALYPDPPPAADYGTFVHLIVGWLELDGMAELVGKEKAREVKRGLVQQYTEEPLSNTDKSYGWYNERVLEDTREIGAILAEHGLIITPDKGLVVQVNED